MLNATYSSYADVYGRIVKGKDYRQEAQYILRRWKELAPNTSQTVCDVGCGLGNHLFYLSEMGFSGYGVDASSEMLSAAQEMLECSSISLILGNDEDVILPEPVSCLVNMFSTYYHKLTPQQSVKALKNYRKNLRPDGILIIDVMEHDRFVQSAKFWCDKPPTFDDITVEHQVSFERGVVLMRKHYKEADGRADALEFTEWFPIRVPTDEELTEELHAAGFSVLRVDRGFLDDGLDMGRTIIVASPT